MNLGGWDTMTAAVMPLINTALAKSASSRPAAFSYTEGDLVVEGQFGAWRIIEGGSTQLLHMAVPVETGTLSGFRPDPVPLDGLELIIEVALRLLPNDAHDRVDLVFSFTRATESAGPAVRMLQVTDPAERFPYIGEALVMAALSEALNANLDGVTHTLAHLETRGSTQDWLRTPYVDWANVLMGDGRQYLAIFGAMRPPNKKMRLDKIDPGLFKGKGTAFFAASHAIFYQKLLQPYLKTNFRPKTRFTASSSGVAAARFDLRPPTERGGPIRPEPEFGKSVMTGLKKVFSPPKRKNPKRRRAAGGPVERLTVDGLVFRCKGSALEVDVSAVALLKAARLLLTVKVDMPFRITQKTGAIGFDRDKSPDIKHRTVPRKDVDFFTGSVGFLVTTVVVELARKKVYGMVSGVTGKLQNINTPTRMPASWIGIRDFEASQARLGKCFWFRDDRPV